MSTSAAATSAPIKDRKGALEKVAVAQSSPRSAMPLLQAGSEQSASQASPSWLLPSSHSSWPLLLTTPSPQTPTPQAARVARSEEKTRSLEGCS
jgi:hypothetical protein